MESDPSSSYWATTAKTTTPSLPLYSVRPETPFGHLIPEILLRLDEYRGLYGEVPNRLVVSIPMYHRLKAERDVSVAIGWQPFERYPELQVVVTVELPDECDEFFLGYHRG